MQVHLVDGTYELFRYFYSPGGGHTNDAGEQVGAVRGVLRSMVGMLDDGATHLGVATDHVITSFRNDLYPDYKDGSGIDPDLASQFPLLEEALEAAGFTVWAMVDHEADDALASAAALVRSDPGFSRAVICTPDKDLAQCVADPHVVQFDRRAGEIRDEAAAIPVWYATTKLEASAPSARLSAVFEEVDATAMRIAQDEYKLYTNLVRDLIHGYTSDVEKARVLFR